MASATQPDMSVTTSWANLAATNTALSAVDIYLQNKSFLDVVIYVVSQSSGSAPTDENSGILLKAGDGLSLNAAQIWVRSSAPGEVGVSLL